MARPARAFRGRSLAAVNSRGTGLERPAPSRCCALLPPGVQWTRARSGPKIPGLGAASRYGDPEKRSSRPCPRNFAQTWCDTAAARAVRSESSCAGAR